jgi:hypothetical protein
VVVISSGGAAVTVIDARSVDVLQNVLIERSVDVLQNALFLAGPVTGPPPREFGRPGKGFTVTETARKNGTAFESNGIVIDADNVMVRGNQVTFTRTAQRLAAGIKALRDASALIEGNQVTNWQHGISVGNGAVTVRKNQVTGNDIGVISGSATIVGNVATANFIGIFASSAATVSNNSAYLNEVVGFQVLHFTGTFTHNNIFGNGNTNSNCGLINDSSLLNATGNYWGAETGPGAPPANGVCNRLGGTTTATPFATQPFIVTIVKP